MYTQIQKLASAIRNDVIGGLRGHHHNLSMSLEQLEDEIVEERLAILKEYILKGVLPVKDLYISINCIPVDCKDLERCSCNLKDDDLTEVAHFEIPQLLNDVLAIDYIGSNDRLNPFVYYTSSQAHRNHKYRKRGKNKPYVWIDITPNLNGMLDCFVFNAPLLKQVSITAIFKDMRQLKNFSCCSDIEDNASFINTEIKRRLVHKKLAYYRQYAPQNLPNDLAYAAG